MSTKMTSSQPEYEVRRTRTAELLEVAEQFNIATIPTVVLREFLERGHEADALQTLKNHGLLPSQVKP